MQIIEMYNLHYMVNAGREIINELKKRISLIEGDYFEICINCIEKENLKFKYVEFENSQEPFFIEKTIYREIPQIGIIEYNDEKKEILVSYIKSEDLTINRYEIIADGVFQFIYLISLFYNYFPLHASAVERKERAILIFGNSGSGKTTTQRALLSYGYNFYADDIVFYFNGKIANSGEKIVSITQKTKDILAECFGIQMKKNIEHKENVEVIPPKKNIFISPKVIVFPVISSKYDIYVMNQDEVLKYLIERTISRKIPPIHKINYFNILTKLSQSCIGIKFSRTEEFNRACFLDAINFIDKTFSS